MCLANPARLVRNKSITRVLTIVNMLSGNPYESFFPASGSSPRGGRVGGPGAASRTSISCKEQRVLINYRIDYANSHFQRDQARYRLNDPTTAPGFVSSQYYPATIFSANENILRSELHFNQSLPRFLHPTTVMSLIRLQWFNDWSLSLIIFVLFPNSLHLQKICYPVIFAFIIPYY